MSSSDVVTASLPKLEEPSCCSVLQEQYGPTDLPTLSDPEATRVTGRKECSVGKSCGGTVIKLC